MKCNLQYPCSKCTSRGKECVFINDPEASRNKRNAKKAQHRSASPKSISDDNAALSSLGGSSPPPFTHSLATLSSITSHADLDSPFPLLTNSSASISSGSSNSSPRTELFQDGTRHPDIPHTYDVELDTLSLDTQLNRLFTTPTVESYGVDPTSASCNPQANELAWLDGGNVFYPQYQEDGYTFAAGGDAQFPGSPVAVAVGYPEHALHQHQHLPHHQHHHQHIASTGNGMQMMASPSSLGLRTCSTSPHLGPVPMSQQPPHVVDPSAVEIEQYHRALVYQIPGSLQWC